MPENNVSFWTDDPVASVTANSYCDAFESDGIVIASTEEPRCSSCFFCVSNMCHNAVTSGLKLASYGLEMTEKLCPKCANFDSNGCGLATGDIEDESLTRNQVRQATTYSVSDKTGNCPGFRQAVYLVDEGDDGADLDTALFLGGL